MSDFAGRIAVISGTGSSRGVAIAWRLAQTGLRIVGADLDALAAGQVAAASLWQTFDQSSDLTDTTIDADAGYTTREHF